MLALLLFASRLKLSTKNFHKITQKATQFLINPDDLEDHARTCKIVNNYGDRKDPYAGATFPFQMAELHGFINGGDPNLQVMGAHPPSRWQTLDA